MRKPSPNQSKLIQKYLEEVETPSWLIQAHAHNLMLPREGSYGPPSPEEATLIACTVYLGRKLRGLDTF